VAFVVGGLTAGASTRSPRELVVIGTPYIVVWCVERSAVVILRVLHGAQRWPRE
jgi:toxin ParE1/3/4